MSGRAATTAIFVWHRQDLNLPDSQQRLLPQDDRNIMDTEAHCHGFSLDTPVSSPPSSVHASVNKIKTKINAISTLSNLIAEPSLHTTRSHVAHDKRSMCCTWFYKIAPWLLEHTCWRQFAVLWGDSKNLKLHLSMQLLSLLLLLLLLLFYQDNQSGSPYKHNWHQPLSNIQDQQQCITMAINLPMKRK